MHLLLSDVSAFPDNDYLSEVQARFPRRNQLGIIRKFRPPKSPVQAGSLISFEPVLSCPKGIAVKLIAFSQSNSKTLLQ